MSVWPSTVSVIAVPSTRRYGPAGRFSVTVVPPTATDAATGAAEELMESVSVPPKLTPGIASETAAESRPAAPLERMSSRPDAPVIDTGPSATATLFAATVTSPAALTSNAKSPVSELPATAT